MSFDQSNKPIFRAAFVFQPQATCPIALGQVGTWLDKNDGLRKTRNADGTDTIGNGSAIPTIAIAAATTAALAGTPNYANGTAGVGATLTKSTAGALPAQDGVTLGVGDLLLVKNQAAPAQNGLYVVTNAGGSAAWVLTRSPLFDTAAKIKEGELFVPQQGTTQANLIYEYVGNSAPVVGTDAISFTQIALAAAAQRFLAFAGHNGAGACTLTGAKVGDKVTGIIDLAGATVSAAASFEAVITVADQIQQTSASNLSALKYAALLVSVS